MKRIESVGGTQWWEERSGGDVLGARELGGDKEGKRNAEHHDVGCDVKYGIGY